MWISKLKGGSYIETARYDLFLLELQVTNYEFNLETVSNLKKLLVKLWNCELQKNLCKSNLGNACY